MTDKKNNGGDNVFQFPTEEQEQDLVLNLIETVRQFAEDMYENKGLTLYAATAIGALEFAKAYLIDLEVGRVKND